MSATRRVRTVGECDTGRARFNTEVRATEALEQARAFRMSKGESEENMEKRWYSCGRCYGYHLSKETKRDFVPK